MLVVDTPNVSALCTSVSVHVTWPMRSFKVCFGNNRVYELDTRLLFFAEDEYVGSVLHFRFRNRIPYKRQRE